MQETVLVGAAASLTEVLQEIGRSFERANPSVAVRFTFASSGAVLRQIEAGAPIHVFVSAAAQEMDTLQKAGRLTAGTRKIVAGNRLVLITPANDPRLKRWEELAQATVRRIAISDPISVPSGRYAKETLTRRGLWETVAKKAVFGENVRQTLTYVAGNNADAGVVFATDARAEKRVRVAAVAVPRKDHTPIRYFAAATRPTNRPNAAAERFVSYLMSAEAQRIFQRFGFTAPGT
jgi:molybdate transport system substrate-binding protein